jgi:hypothetical protein
MHIHIPLHQIKKENNFTDEIVVSDQHAWIKYPEYHFIYNKLWVAESQDLECGPMYVYPNDSCYPVIFKPIINLMGMSKGIKKINNNKEYDENIRDGFFWEKYLIGEHLCIDVVMKNNEILFTSCLISVIDENDIFQYHYSDPEFVLPEHIKLWIHNFFKDYTGCINLETINGTIIEAHLRLNGDYQLYDKTFAHLLENLVTNNTNNTNNTINNFSNYKIKKKYLLPIFVNKNFNIVKFNKKIILNICKKYTINSLFFDDINSPNQPDNISRLIMLDINILNHGLKLKKKINSYLLNI